MKTCLKCGGNATTDFDPECRHDFGEEGEARYREALSILDKMVEGGSVVIDENGSAFAVTHGDIGPSLDALICHRARAYPADHAMAEAADQALSRIHEHLFTAATASSAKASARFSVNAEPESQGAEAGLPQQAAREPDRALVKEGILEAVDPPGSVQYARRQVFIVVRNCGPIYESDLREKAAMVCVTREQASDAAAHLLRLGVIERDPSTNTLHEI